MFLLRQPFLGDFMFQYLTSMSAYDIIAQILGLCGLAASVCSFQRNTHKGIMALQMAAGMFFTANLFMLHAYTGALLNAIAIIRSIVLYHREKGWVEQHLKQWLAAFCVVFGICGVIGMVYWEGVLALIPAFAMVVNTFSFAASRPKTVRATILLSSPFWLFYDFVKGSVGGYVNETLVILSAIIGLIRYDIPRKKRKPDSNE